jgi:hypothetical protein
MDNKWKNPTGPGEASNPSGHRRRLLRMLLKLAILYALFALGVALFQRRLIYIPTRLDPAAVDQFATQQGFRPWRNASGDTIGWHLPASGPSSGSVLVAHGNAGCALYRGYLVRPIHEAGSVDVYVLEYPGYGTRSGSPSQRSILGAADEALGVLPKTRPVYVVSESLGAGVAAHLARYHPDRIAGLLLFAPYDNFVAVARRQMPFLPVSLLLWDRFNPALWLADYRGPMVVVLAEKDRLVPADLGRRLYDGYAGPKRLHVIPGAGHNDIAEQPAEWWREVFSFWELRSPDPGSESRESPDTSL